MYKIKCKSIGCFLGYTIEKDEIVKSLVERFPIIASKRNVNDNGIIELSKLNKYIEIEKIEDNIKVEKNEKIEVDYQVSPRDLCEMQSPTDSRMRPLVCLPNELLVSVYTNLTSEDFIPDAILE